VGEAVTREARREDLAALLRPYLLRVRGELRQHLRQPRMLGREAEPRVVKLGVTIDAEGRVVAVRVRESCGTEHLDELALGSIRAVDRVSAPPSGLPWTHPRELTFPVVYQ
jgi:TonB family protein